MATTAEEIQQIIDDSRAYAEDSLEKALDLSTDAQDAANGIVTVIDPGFAFEVEDNKLDFKLSDPNAFTDSYNPPINDLESPVFETLYYPSIPDLPDAPAELDTSNLFQFDRPLFDLADFSETAPDVQDVTLPTAPDIQFGDPPEDLQDQYIAPVISPPDFDETFDGQRPDATDIDELNINYESKYREMLPEMQAYIDCKANDWLNKYAPCYGEVMDKLCGQLKRGLDDEIQCIPDDVEQQIFDRGRAKAERERERLDTDLEEQWAKRGYEHAPAALLAGLQMNQHETARIVSGVAAETAIERARLQHDFRKFTMELANSMLTSMRTQLIQYYDNLTRINGQALEYSKEFAKNIVDAYNAGVRLYEVEAQVFRTLAQVYEVRLEAAFAELRSFEAQMNALKTVAEVEEVQIRKYLAGIEAEKAKIDIYVAELRGISEQVNVGRQRVEIFGEKVRAYLATVQAKEAEFGAYKAAIDGDEARVQAYLSQVNAYRGRVDAIRSVADIEKTRADVVTDNNRNLVTQFEAEVRRYTAELEAEGRRFSSSSDAYRAGLERYAAVLRARVAEQENLYKADELNLDAAKTAYRGELETIFKNADLFRERVELQAETATSLTNIMSAIAQAALNSQNNILEVSASGT